MQMQRDAVSIEEMARAGEQPWPPTAVLAVVSSLPSDQRRRSPALPSPPTLPDASGARGSRRLATLPDFGRGVGISLPSADAIDFLLAQAASTC